ncbi:MAG: hypothetical protein RBU23_12865 [Candidatus Auribacterota bacterium]|jgi:hypothetical protein|nr:hypothetical protein [Candidatus Auribacterota bacterium]
MFNIYKQIADRLRDQLPELKTIDADKGQLSDPEHAFPIDYPAVLIDLDNIDWADLGNNAQKGKSKIAVTVAVLPVHQSHQDSPTIDGFVEQMEIVNSVYTVLSGFLGLSRVNTHRQKRYDTVQAYTHVFTNNLVDRSAQKGYVKKQALPDLKIYTPNTIANFPEVLE